MDVSVVIPTFDRADLLAFTLDAILAQTVLPAEIIVVDDGSRDGTGNVLSRYSPRIRCVRIENSGSIVARNVGLRAASNQLVAFCDSDDVWQPRFLEVMTGLWRAEPRLRVAYCNFQIVRGWDWENRTKFDDAPDDYWNGLCPLAEGCGTFKHSFVDRIIRWQPFFPSALVVDRAAMLSAGGWDEGVGRTIGDDFGTVLRLAELLPFGVAFEPLVGIRKHIGNFSANSRAMNLGDANILEYTLRTRPSLAGHATLIRDSAIRRRIDALDSAFADGDYDAVHCIHRLLPPHSLSFRAWLKVKLTGFPPLAAMVGRTSAKLRRAA